MRKTGSASCVFLAACSWISGSVALSESNLNYECLPIRYPEADEEKTLLFEELRILRKIDHLCLDLKEVQRKIENERRKLAEIRHRLSCMKYKGTY